jgi:hypothetical protein
MSARTAIGGVQSHTDSVLDTAAEKARGAMSEARKTEFGSPRQVIDNINLVVVVGVTHIVAVLVMNELATAINVTTGPFSGAYDSTVDLAGTSLGIAPIVMLVIVATIVLSILRRM